MMFNGSMTGFQPVRTSSNLVGRSYFAMPKKDELTRIEETLERIQTCQLGEIRNLKDNAQMLLSTSESLLKKIEEVGINGYYSVNSEALRYSKNIWKASYRLSKLKQFEKIIKGKK